MTAAATDVLTAEEATRSADVTEALGGQVRRAVELLVARVGRGPGGEPTPLSDVAAHDVYRGAVSVLMRIVFLLFAEDRRLLPSSSVGQLAAELERAAAEGGEHHLEHGFGRWQRLVALVRAVQHGMERYPWLPAEIDDRTVLHLLRSVRYVEVGTGKARERRRVTFGQLDVEQIGHVYEGLLSHDARRAPDVVVGLVGTPGLEAAVALARLEELAARCSDVHGLAEALAAEYKGSGIGSVAAIQNRLAPLGPVERERARSTLLSVTGDDSELADRLLPFARLIRPDLHARPLVVRPGEFYVTASPLRKDTGAHYTPRQLAEQIVEGALAPLVHSPGPLETADEDRWRLRSSREILSLKVADIAMGSAAFLVATARYLGGKLVDAWTREGDPRARAVLAADDGTCEDDDPIVVEARRQVIEHCLYGADVNELAVEMAKLSLLLLSMDSRRPFAFLDDRLVAGDALLGITSPEQLEYLHVDPAAGRAVHEETLVDVRDLLAEAAGLRLELAGVDGSTPAGLARKRSLLGAADATTARARLLADLTVGAALHHAGRGDKGLATGSTAAAELARRIGTDEPQVRRHAREWLDADRPEAAFTRRTLHWPLAFPEVFESGGFDAVVGNPPFLGGQKLSATLGTAYREYLVRVVGSGVRGSADLVAYFVLRAHRLLGAAGQTGLIATNTLAQGDTREVGLDQLVDDGVVIRQSVKSKPWPSTSAVLEYCAVWTTRRPPHEHAHVVADGVPVARITPSLDPGFRVSGPAHRLAGNLGRAYQGSNILGLGFTMDPGAAAALVERDGRNAEVLFPYLNGRDLTSRPDLSASRWVVNFHDWPQERAKTYPECYERAHRLVRPERATNRDRQRRELWWRFTRPTSDLYRAVAGLDRVIVIARVSKAVVPVMVPTGQVISEAVVVFATDDTAMLALLSSAVHFWWAKSRGSTLETRIRYTPSDVFETFPLPEPTAELRELGERLDTVRRGVMLARGAGLTKTYNLVFEPACTDDDVEELRRIHRAIDEATIRVYRWDDRIASAGGLDHGFHRTDRETRYTIGPVARHEVLDSLLELNHERHAAEGRGHAGRVGGYGGPPVATG